MPAINGVLLQGFHWYTPADGQHWNQLAGRAKELAGVGFTAIWIPPPYKGSGGAKDVGYGVYDMFDVGEFDQRGSVRTKYGTRHELEHATRALRDAGIHVLVDVVLNHRLGGDAAEECKATPYAENNRLEPIGEPRTIKPFTHFTFPGRGNQYSNLQWHWHHFTAVDYDSNNPEYKAVYLLEGKQFDHHVDLEKGSYDYLMGCDLDVHHPEVVADIKGWATWYYDSIGLDGVRFDAVKHVEANFFPDWLKHLRNHAKRRIFAVGEYWSYNVEALHAFIAATDGDVHLFDAPLLKNFAEASRAGKAYDLRTIFDNTLVRNEPALAVTIVANHDTQPLQSLENVVEAWFTPIAYAITLLRRDGYPCVFLPDYDGAQYTDKGRDGQDHTINIPSHRFLIERYLTCRKEHAYGDQHNYFDHPTCAGWTRTGTAEHPGGLAVVLSTADAGVKRMNIGPANASYRDITGHLDATITTNEHGEADFPCPAGSLSVWVPAGA
jgi:alpha-amylase